MDTNDHDAIRAIIDRQFGSLNWDPTTLRIGAHLLEIFARSLSVSLPCGHEAWKNSLSA